MRKTLTIVILALFCGCVSVSKTADTTTTSIITQTTQTTTSTITSITSTTTTLPLNRTKLCAEARKNESIYQRCKQTAQGQIHLPQDELQRCAQIQQHAGEYARNIYHCLTYCVGLPAGGIPAPSGEGASFCKDLPQENQDDCYMSVRQCDRIVDRALRQKCLSET